MSSGGSARQGLIPTYAEVGFVLVGLEWLTYNQR